jgi:hypothetical protein
MKDALIAIAAMAGLALLIVAKSDKQMIHLLEGRLHKHDCDTTDAKVAFRRHTRVSSVVCIVLGMCLASLAVVLFVGHVGLYPIPALIGVTIFGVGVWGRVQSFRRADSDLSLIIQRP